MFSFNETHKKILMKYPRSIVHMRSQLRMKRFGLVFGSGFSKEFGLPMWPDLIKNIAEDPEVDGTNLLKELSKTESLPYQTELLLQHYKRKKAEGVDPNRLKTKSFEYETLYGWFKIVAKHLYTNPPTDFVSEVVEHPYMKTYLPIIKQTMMTVTYNFDNYIERSLEHMKRVSDSIKTRGFETITNPLAQFRRTDSVIYHPNGFFHPELMEVPVDKFIFSEASFAEEYAKVLSGDQSALINHFSKHTCLLIGLSLKDEILRNLLCLCSKSTVGNYHYLTYYIDKENEIDSHQREAIKRTNFNVYNLITLFMTKDEIIALGELINPDLVPEDTICDQMKRIGSNYAFRFYLTGPLGVGKSTTANNFRNLQVFDEWLQERLEILAKPWDDLSDKEKNEADNWIVDQFRKKDENLRNAKSGIYIVDRPPLDPLAFTPTDQQKIKAEQLLNAICPETTDWRVQDGTVILLIGDPSELEVRLLLTGRDKYNAEKLKKMEKAMRNIYDNMGRVIVDTHGLTINEVAKRVAEIIHLDAYIPFDLHSRLEKFKVLYRHIVYSYVSTSFTLSGMISSQKGGDHGLEGNNDDGAENRVH